MYICLDPRTRRLNREEKSRVFKNSKGLNRNGIQVKYVHDFCKNPGWLSIYNHMDSSFFSGKRRMFVNVSCDIIID